MTERFSTPDFLMVELSTSRIIDAVFQIGVHFFDCCLFLFSGDENLSYQAIGAIELFRLLNYWDYWKIGLIWAYLGHWTVEAIVVLGLLNYCIIGAILQKCSPSGLRCCLSLACDPKYKICWSKTSNNNQS